MQVQRERERRWNLFAIFCLPVGAQQRNASLSFFGVLLSFSILKYPSLSRGGQWTVGQKHETPKKYA